MLGRHHEAVTAAQRQLVAKDPEAWTSTRDEVHSQTSVRTSSSGSYRTLAPAEYDPEQTALKDDHMSYYCSACVMDWPPQQTDDGHCPTCGGGTVKRQTPAGEARVPSRLELAETAHMAARLCWLWPDDEDQRTAAIEACDAVNVDYIEALACIMRDTAASAPVARRHVAEALRKAADRIYAADGRSEERAET